MISSESIRMGLLAASAVLLANASARAGKPDLIVF
jgi:hypothetical protein